MKDQQLKITCQLRCILSLSLLGSVLTASAMMTSAAAAYVSDAVASSKDVSFAETVVNTDSVDTGQVAPVGDVEVTVLAGDSLSSILRDKFGTLSALTEVARYNNLYTPDTLVPGQKILIPAFLFSNLSDTQVLANEIATDSENPVQQTASEDNYVVVDLTELLAVNDLAVSDLAVNDLVLDELAANDVDATRLSESEQVHSEQAYNVVDLSELALSSDPESAVQSTESESLYNVVDLTEVGTTPDRRITVNPGDSLSSILRQNLGSLRALAEVLRYNKLDTADVLQPGQIILIPGYL